MTIIGVKFKCTTSYTSSYETCLDLYLHSSYFKHSVVELFLDLWIDSFLILRLLVMYHVTNANWYKPSRLTFCDIKPLYINCVIFKNSVEDQKVPQY